MSNNALKLLYRHFYKNNPILRTSNVNLYKDFIKDEVVKFQLKDYTPEVKERKLKQYSNLILNYIEMKQNITKEQFLLNYYGVNEYVDQMKKIQQVARYCGLNITDTKKQLNI